MADYIKREDALKALREYPVTKLKTVIRRLPSADVAPIRHGVWVYKDESIFGNPYGRYYCDLCEYGMADKENYCPCCGARMDSEEKDCDTCKHSAKRWDEYPCDGCTTANSHWERKDDE